MKITMTAIAMIFGILTTAAIAEAECTRNPFQMGWDAAKFACDDISSNYVPLPYSSRTIAGHATPERTCSVEDVVRCKNAMAQYLRRHHACSSLIRRDVRLYDAYGNSTGTAQDVWRTYVLTTCNQ